MAKIKNYMKFLSLFIVLVLLFSLFGLSDTHVAYAVDNTDDYTNVLDDLQKDEDFVFYKYPVISNNHSLDVIQIAEGKNKELFIYVYQPSASYDATSINISKSLNDDLAFANYKLKLCSKDKSLSKYLVENFTISNDKTRYYCISSIFRNFIKGVDTVSEGNNSINEVAYNIGREYCFYEENNETKISVREIETITITDKFVGFVRYPDGFKLVPSSCDSHFVAFNTDKKIDQLMQADVYYTAQDYTYSISNLGHESYSFGHKVEKIATLNYKDKVEYQGHGLFAGKYSWDRIETVDNFIANENINQDVYTGVAFDYNVGSKISEEGIKNLKGKEWVLRFTETKISATSFNGNVTQENTSIGNVTILRLKFETDGIIKNLGVIDNKTNGSKNPINDITKELNLTDKAKFILGIILGILALILIILILGPVLPYIIKAILLILIYPFKLISELINKNKKGGSR